MTKIHCLRLSSGLEIEGPHLLVDRFFSEIGHPLYDLLPVAQDNILDPTCLVSPAYFLTYAPAFEGWRQIWAKKSEIEALLSSIPCETQLYDEDVPWEPLERIFDAFMETPYFKLATTSKILHKKRPKLIPILDELVLNYYRNPIEHYVTELNAFLIRKGDKVKFSAETFLDSGSGVRVVSKLIREDLRTNLGVLKQIRDEISDRYDLTLLRILDIILWTNARMMNSSLKPSRGSFPRR